MQKGVLVKMSRSQAREYAFKLTFEYLFNKQPDENIEEFDIINVDEKNFVQGLFDCVKTNFDDIEQKLQQSIKYPKTLKDIYTLDHAILIISIAEIDYLKQDKGVVINEAVRLAKRYSSDKSPKFINGVLSSIYNG